MTKILTVCKGNIFRSPYAAAEIQRLVLELEGAADARCESAGTKGYHIGKMADRSTIDLARTLGVDLLSHRARQLDGHMLKAADFILVMDEGNRLAIESEHGPNLDPLKIELLGSYAGLGEIPDPYGRGEEVLAESFRMISKCASEFVRQRLS